MTGKIAVGIVGAGLRGRLFAAAIESSPHGAVLACADPRARQFGAAIRIGSRTVPAYSDVDEMFRAHPLDAVIIATPDHLHAAPVLAAASRQLPMLIEKPLATTESDTRAIRDAVVASAAPCMIAFENRWNPAFVAAKQAVSDANFGALRYQRANLSNTTFVPTEMLSWAKHSSPLWFLMSHTVDLVSWLASARVTKVFATAGKGTLLKMGIDTWDVVHAVLDLSNGSTVSLTSSWILSTGHPAIVDFTYEAIGEHESIQFDVIAAQTLNRFAEKHLRAASAGTVDGFEIPSAPVLMARSFVRSIATGAATETTLADALYVNDVIFAIERSIATCTAQSVIPMN